MNSIEKIISDSKLDGYKKQAALRELADRRPPRLSEADRAAVTDLAEKFKTAKAAWVGFESRLKRFQQDLSTSQTEQHRLRTTLDPDDTDGINRLTFLSTKLSVLSTSISTAPARQSEMRNTAENLFRCLDEVLTKNYGSSKTLGRSLFSSCAFGELPLRLDLALAELDELLK